MDKRAVFFLGSAFVCLLLAPATPANLRWFAFMLSGVYAVLAIASALDTWSRHRHEPDDRSSR